MKDDLNILLKELGNSKCPYPVDVVDDVMNSLPEIPRRKPLPMWLRTTSVAAACIIGLIVVDVALIYSSDYNDDMIGTMIATSYELNAESYYNYTAYQEYLNADFVDVLMAAE